jgi:hypothetical protein
MAKAKLPSGYVPPKDLVETILKSKVKIPAKSPIDRTAKRYSGLRPPWKKGQPSANPHGHPKGQPNIAYRTKRTIIEQLQWTGQLGLSDVKKKFVSKYFPEVNTTNLNADDLTWLQTRIAAIKGEEWAQKFIAAYLIGLPKQFVEVTFHDLARIAKSLGEIVLRYVPKEKTEECLKSIEEALAKVNEQ